MALLYGSVAELGINCVQLQGHVNQYVAFGIIEKMSFNYDGVWRHAIDSQGWG